jgi:3-oxoacyl-[acyl-carrier protein] reductase
MAPEPKVIVITGAGSGIGRALTINFARDGNHVVAFGRHATSLAETASAARADRVTCVVGSTASEEDVERLVEEATRAHGRIDVLINNAAVYPKAMLADCSPRDWLNTLEINVVGPLICYQKVLPGMLQRSYGRIINMGSFAGRAPFPGSSDYGVSKAALSSLNKFMAAEIDRAKHPDVLVNELVPSSIKTRMSKVGDDASCVYPYVLSLINLPPGGPSGQIFLKNAMFHDDWGIKARLKRKINKMLVKKTW